MITVSGTETAIPPPSGSRRWFGRRGDLLTHPFPALSGGDLPSRFAAVEELRRWAERRATTLTLVREFAEDISGKVAAETKAWLTEFRANISELHNGATITPRGGG